MATETANALNHPTLANKNASAEAVRLYEYICESYGKVMLSAQQEFPSRRSTEWEMDYVCEKTGKLPAIRGLDFMHADFKGTVERAKKWHERGGIVTFCWHTGIYGGAYKECLDGIPAFERILDEKSDAGSMMIRNWDRAARALAELRDCHIPVLWRPFHEFDGGWFWWGKGGADNFIALWKLMFDRFTDKWGLDNLIWVLGYSGEVKDGWYVGDDCCDIVGSDTYDGTSHKEGYDKVAKLCNKPLCFHECGNLPHFDDFIRDECLWAWFMNWHTRYLKDNDSEILKEVYNRPEVVTLDKLPKLWKL